MLDALTNDELDLLNYAMSTCCKALVDYSPRYKAIRLEVLFDNDRVYGMRIGPQPGSVEIATPNI